MSDLLSEISRNASIPIKTNSKTAVKNEEVITANTTNNHT